MSTSFDVPKRQHPLGVFIIGAQFIWKAVQSFWPILIGVTLGEMKWYYFLAIPVGVLFAGAFALWYYLRFHFFISSDALIVERGIFQRERLQIPFDRIQAVQLFQGPIQQVFGLTGVRVDTAGSSGSELELVAIRKAEATILQQFLNSKMSLAPETGEDEPVDSDPHRSERVAKPLVALGTKDLVKVGLSQNHIKNAFLGLALFMSLFQGAEDHISNWLDGIPAAVVSIVGLSFVLLFIPGLVLMGIVGVLTSLGSVFLRYWRLNSTLDEDGLKLQMGLLRRNSFDVPFNKIHLTEWKSNWIRRLLGYETVRIRQAQAEGSGGLRVFIPAMEPLHRAAMEVALYPDLRKEAVFDVSPARRLRWILLAAASVPSILLLTHPEWGNVILALCWTAFVFWTTGRRYESYRLSVYIDSIVLERGWFWQTRTVLKMSQLQGVEWKRNALLERRKIGHLVFHTAAGQSTFNYVNRDQAAKIRDFALNQLHAAQPKNQSI